MTVYFNMSRRGEQSAAVEKSREAGDTITKALEAGMKVLRPFEGKSDPKETPVPAEAHNELVNALRHASALYTDLEKEVSPDPIQVGPSMRRALLAAVTCSEVLGAMLYTTTGFLAALLHPESSPSSSGRLSPKTLMQLARLLTLEASNDLAGINPSAMFPRVGRRIAADLVIIQLIGIITAELLDRWARATELKQ